jgi:hypothetical protein
MTLARQCYIECAAVLTLWFAITILSALHARLDFYEELSRALLTTGFVLFGLGNICSRANIGIVKPEAP